MSPRVPANVAAEWDVFTAAVGARLTAGQAAYGDRSLDAAPAVLAGEVAEELEDVCGWAFVLWRRLRALHGRLSAGAPAQRPARRRRR